LLPSLPMRTLVIDDSPDIRELIQTILTTKGRTEVLTADSAREAFRHLGIEDHESGDAAIDLILMGIMMSDIDGIGACRRIKAVGGFIPICASCKKIRDDKGLWHNIEAYLQAHSDIDFSHGLCPQCKDKRLRV